MTRPIRPAVSIARMAAHMQAARQPRQARTALGGFGQTTISIRLGLGRARLIWQIPLARRLTLRQSEVDCWVVKGMSSRDIGDILGASRATVKKRLERVYESLGVEPRIAAASVALQRVSELKPA